MTIAMRNFVQLATFMCLVLSVTLFVSPEWYEVGAYAWVHDTFGFTTLAVVWAVLTCCFSYMLVRPVKHWFAVVTISAYSWAQFVFAFSILKLTLDGSSPGAFVGSMMWGGYAYLGWHSILHNPSWKSRTALESKNQQSKYADSESGDK